jgi:Uma2 family endonuclease
MSNLVLTLLEDGDSYLFSPLGAVVRLPRMIAPAPADARYTAERYFALVEEGVLRPDDRVELLEGVIVSMAPQGPPHAYVIMRLHRILFETIGTRAAIRGQMPFVAGPYSVPEPDIAVVPGPESAYLAAHPTTAHLVVEVAETSTIQDRLTKAAIYAAAGVPQYWLVNLPDDCIEVFSGPDRLGRLYRHLAIARRGARLEIAALPGATVAVADLLPPS